jgi:hypothetical protein
MAPRATHVGFAALSSTLGRVPQMRVSGAAPGYLNPGTREGPRTDSPRKARSRALNKRPEPSAPAERKRPGEPAEKGGSSGVSAGEWP